MTPTEDREDKYMLVYHVKNEKELFSWLKKEFENIYKTTPAHNTNTTQNYIQPTFGKEISSNLDTYLKRIQKIYEEEATSSQSNNSSSISNSSSKSRLSLRSQFSSATFSTISSKQESTKHRQTQKMKVDNSMSESEDSKTDSESKQSVDSKSMKKQIDEQNSKIQQMAAHHQTETNQHRESQAQLTSQLNELQRQISEMTHIMHQIQGNTLTSKVEEIKPPPSTPLHHNKKPRQYTTPTKPDTHSPDQDHTQNDFTVVERKNKKHYEKNHAHYPPQRETDNNPAIPPDRSTTVVTRNQHRLGSAPI